MKIKKLVAGGLSILLSIGMISFSSEYAMVTHAAIPPDIKSQGAAVYNANTDNDHFDCFRAGKFE